MVRLWIVCAGVIPLFTWILLPYLWPKVLVVNSDQELAQALDEVQPGQKIILGPITFKGQFTAKQNGSFWARITVEGQDARTKVTCERDGTAFKVVGNYWKFKNLRISSCETGFLLKGTDNQLIQLEIVRANKAIDIQGERNVIQRCSIYRVSTYGIRVRANGSVIIENSIMTYGPASIIVENGTCCGSVNGNNVSGGIYIDGSDYPIYRNVAPMKVTGCRNFIYDHLGYSSLSMNSCNKDTQAATLTPFFSRLGYSVSIGIDQGKFRIEARFGDYESVTDTTRILRRRR